MRKIPTQIRVQPLRSNDFTSKKFSLTKSLAHDMRKYDEEHIDKERSKLNIVIGEPDKIIEKINALKNEYGTITKRTTIDCANFIMTVNKNFFEQNKKYSQEIKQNF